MLVFSKYVYFDSFFPTKLILSGVKKKSSTFLPTKELFFFFFYVAMENECSLSANMVENS